MANVPNGIETLPKFQPAK